MEGSTIKMTKMEEISKMFIRRFKKIKYLNVELAPGYEQTEKEYKSLKDSILLLENSVNSMSNYEHGNKVYKNIKKGLQYISDKASLKMYKNSDIFENAAAVGEGVSKINGNAKFETVGKKFYEIYTSISKSKQCLNTKLSIIKVKIKEMKTKASEIDEQRKQVRNMRYDLEVLLQDGGYNDEIKEVEKEEYNKAAKNTIKAMKYFIDDSEIPQLMKDLSKDYKKHMEETIDLLKFIV